MDGCPATSNQNSPTIANPNLVPLRPEVNPDLYNWPSMMQLGLIEQKVEIWCHLNYQSLILFSIIYSSLKTEENLETVKRLPVNKILIETDCPWCEIRPSHASFKYISKESLIPSVKKESGNQTIWLKVEMSQLISGAINE
ncbi:hypothetical protein NQ317_008444 [Molorchus minor]|uniref:Uncharacterized protein n=1 Tax=Molorchus minor TaxID=1323400 RepID=A0ABQ9JDR0_9CUCU|nr:hypothetical protein NQ317_008444 [Molorchus minor]